jgi:hypothetical protein
MNARSRSRQPRASARTPALLVVGLVGVIGLAAPPSATAAYRFRGTTSQGAPVSVLVPAGFYRVARISLSVRVVCGSGTWQGETVGGPFRLRGTRPWRGLVFGGIRNSRVDLGNGNTAALQETLNGRVGARGPMRGTFRAIATISGPDGQAIDTCNTGTITWRASQR